MATEAGLLQRARHAGLSTWLLAAFCGWALLLWAGALLGMGGRIGVAAASAGGDLPAAKAAVPDRIGPLNQYSDAAARPLFTEDRRPRSFLATVQEGEGQDAASNKLDFLLTGVLISPQVRLAILQPTGGGESQRVREGSAPEGAAGWRLVEVQPRKALFEGGNGQATLDLRAFGDAGALGGQVAAMSAQPPPPPVPTVISADDRNAASAANAEGGRTAPVDQQARIEAIRRRIEARRAQMRANGQNSENNANQPPAATQRRQ